MREGDLVRIILFRILFAVTLLSVNPSLILVAKGAPHEGGTFIDGNLLKRINENPGSLELIFPGAEELLFIDGRPPVIEVTIGGSTAGYIFSTLGTVNATGYAGIAFDLVGGVDIEGNITGAAILYHREAIIGRGVEEQALLDWVAGFAAASLNDFKMIKPDDLNRATISGRLMRGGLQSSARLVHNQYVMGGIGPVTEPALDRNGFFPLTNDELISGNSIKFLTISNIESIEMFREIGGENALPSGKLTGGLDDEFTRIVTTFLSPASIGANVFGDTRFNELKKIQGEEGFMFLMGAGGTFSYQSNSHFKKANDYKFDQFLFRQNGKEFIFNRDMTTRISVGQRNIQFSQNLKNLGVFYLNADSGFDPLLPWEIVLKIPGTDSDGKAIWVERILNYSLPDRHKLLPPPPPTPEWIIAWSGEKNNLLILAGLLSVVTLVFIFQDSLVRRRKLYTFVRIGVLSFTLGWLGFWTGAQISIVNVMAYMMAPFQGVGWNAFILDPLILVIMVYTAFSLFILGRGVFCGWLCPFGALQELLNRIALIIKLPQLKINHTIQERLWVIKYLAAIAILGLGFVSIDVAETVAEIEPFKTVISVKFDRDWPFVLYALTLLAAGLFVERFYCRFLCPLGGSLAFFGRIHMFEWLKRKHQCGTQCRICESDCPMGAIEPSGKIDMNECFQCLDCQVDYYDDQKCPPLIQRRKRKETPIPEETGVLPPLEGANA